MVILFLCFFLFFSAPPLWTQDSYEDLEGGLNLNPQQKIRVERIRKKYLQELMSIRDEILTKKLELVNEARKENPDPERISKIRREMEDLRIKREILFGKYRDEVNAILNREQKKKFDDFCRKERRRIKRPFD